MDTRKGSCWTMPLLYLSVAQRLGYPIYPVSAPQHIFLRYNDTNLAMQNIEATNGGYTPDDEYIYTLEIPQKGIESGAYMKSLTYKEFLGEMIGENGRYWAQHGDMEKAREYLEIAIELEPTGAEIAVSLGSVYWHLDQDKDGLPSMDYKGKSKYYMNKAQELGAGKMIDENYLVRQRQLEKEYREKNNVK
jgi:regulator of sirC expression with transglutaminase-like and TPR domain